MKHNFSFLPTLRRITLFAILLLGAMPMWAETTNLYIRAHGDAEVDYPVDLELQDLTHLTEPVCGQFWFHYSSDTYNQNSFVLHVEYKNVQWGYTYFSDWLTIPLSPGETKYLILDKSKTTWGTVTDFNSECGTPTPTCPNCEYLGKE